MEKTEICRNCEKKMPVDIEPYIFDEIGNNTVVRSFYGGYCCDSDCEEEFDKRMRRSAEIKINL